VIVPATPTPSPTPGPSNINRTVTNTAVVRATPPPINVSSKPAASTPSPISTAIDAVSASPTAKSNQIRVPCITPIGATSAHPAPKGVEDNDSTESESEFSSVQGEGPFPLTDEAGTQDTFPLPGEIGNQERAPTDGGAAADEPILLPGNGKGRFPYK
jgi:hypothetical protein